MVLVCDACNTVTWPPVYVEGSNMTAMASIPAVFSVLENEQVSQQMRPNTKSAASSKHPPQRQSQRRPTLERGLNKASPSIASLTLE